MNYKEEFNRQYVVTFLASYMASRYDSDRMNGHPIGPYNQQPVEDAIFLAECAWQQYLEALKNGR